MSKVYLGLGSNIGDRLGYLKKAMALIKNFHETELIKISKVYETEPWGYTEQDDYLNLCLEIKTTLSPYKLLTNCQEVEKNLRRERKIKWGPRTIDIDILLYDDLVLEEDDLIIPHPRIQERAFILIPLRDLNNKLMIKGKKLEEWIEIVGEDGVRPSL